MINYQTNKNFYMKNVAMLGTGLIGLFYTMSLHAQRKGDRVVHVYSRRAERAEQFAKDWSIPRWTNDMSAVINDPLVDVVVVGLPNNLHLEAITLAAKAGKAILCTKPLGRTALEAKEMLEIVEQSGVFHGYLEDLAYTPKTLKSLDYIQKGSIGKVIWTRSREAHPGPHSDWFWDPKQSGGGVLIDMGCHCIEIGRNFIGKDIRPVEVVCWAETQVKPIEAEDHAIGLVKYENGAIGQFEVSWNYRGGMDLRDEVAGTDGNIRLDHFLRTGFEIFSAARSQGYVAEKAESQSGWLFPVGDELNELGYPDMFADMFDSLENGKQPMENFYDGYVVNAIMDACYKSAKSKKWEPVELEIWRGKSSTDALITKTEYDENNYLIKTEILPDGRKKVILKDKVSGEISERLDN